jgi:hypothetical protein
VSAKIAAADQAGLGRKGVPGQTRQFASQNLLIASAVTWGDSPVLNRQQAQFEIDRIISDRRAEALGN